MMQEYAKTHLESEAMNALRLCLKLKMYADQCVRLKERGNCLRRCNAEEQVQQQGWLSVHPSLSHEHQPPLEYS